MSQIYLPRIGDGTDARNPRALDLANADDVQDLSETPSPLRHLRVTGEVRP